MQDIIFHILILSNVINIDNNNNNIFKNENVDDTLSAPARS